MIMLFLWSFKGVGCQRELRHRMVVSYQSDGRGVVDVVYNIDAAARLLNAETLAGENLPVTFGMQVGEALAELNQLFPHHDGAIGGFASGLAVIR